MKTLHTQEINVRKKTMEDNAKRLNNKVLMVEKEKFLNRNVPLARGVGPYMSFWIR